jgi:hypothetical protein
MPRGPPPAAITAREEQDRASHFRAKVTVTAAPRLAPRAAAALPPGFYLLALVARAEGGTESLTLTQPLRIEGSAP